MITLLIVALLASPALSNRWSRQLPPGQINNGDWIPVSQPCPNCRQAGSRVLNYPLQQPPTFFPHPIFSPAQQPFSLFGEPFALQPQYSPISAQQFVPQAQKPHNVAQIVPQPLIQHQNNQPISQQQMNYKQLPKEEKEEVQLLYVPLETLRQRGKHQNTPKVNPGGIKEYYYQPTATPATTTTTRSTTTSKPKQKPHQPALAMFMSKHDDKFAVSDVLTLLKDAKSIPVLDNLGSQSPEVFVGPSALKVPENYVRFDLPYLSSIEHNRVERKVEDYPFFVAPLSYKAPEGYSKIPFPAPHVGSIVVKPPQITSTTVTPSLQTFFPTESTLQGNFAPFSHTAFVTPSTQTGQPINNQHNRGHFVTQGVQQFSTARPVQNIQNTHNFVQNGDLKQQNYNGQQQYNNAQQQFVHTESTLPNPTQIENQRQQQHFRSQVQQQQPDLPRFAQQENQQQQPTSSKQQDQQNYQTTIPELVNDNLPYFVEHDPIHQISSTNKPITNEDFTANNYYTQSQQVNQQRGSLIRQQQEDQLIRQQQNEHQVRKQEEEELLRKQEEEARTRREEEEKLLQKQQQEQVFRQQEEERILRQQQEEQILRQQQEEQLLRQQQEERILRQKKEEQARLEAERKERQQQEDLKRIKEQEERKIRQQQLEERQQRERLRQQELRQRQKLQQQKKQEQELLQQQQEHQQYLQDQLSLEEELEIRKQIPEEPQYVQFKELINIRSTEKPTTKEQEEFEMKQYFKQQSEFKSLSQNPEYQQQQQEQQQTPIYAPETESVIESSTPQYSLPSELPAINAHLPGLINSLQDGTRHFSLDLGTVSTTTSTPPSTSTYFTRRPQTRGRRPVPTRASTVSDYTTRRTTTRGRRPYTGSRYTPRPVVKPDPQQSVQEKQQEEEVSVFISSPIPAEQGVSTTELPLKTTAASRSHSRYQNRYNYNSDDSTESQRKSQIRQRFRTRGRPQYTTTKKPEEENYPKLPIVATTEESKISEVLNLEMAKEPVREYYPTQSPLDSYVDITTANYDNVSKYEHITIITPSSTDAQQYTQPQEIREQVSEYYISPSVQTEDDINDNNLRKEMKVSDDTFVEEPAKNEEDYGFTRIPKFPPIFMQTPEQRFQIQNSPNVHPVYVPTETHTTEETREIEQPKIRKNHFLRRPSRPITTTSTPATTNYPTTEVARRGRYTVRPTRRPEPTNLPKITKIRGRIRKPTSTTTTTEKVDPSNEVEFDQVPTPRPTHRYISRFRSSEVPEEQTEASSSAFRITVDPDDQYTYESIRRPHYLNLDVQESQWSPKLTHNSFQPYVPRGKGERALHNKDHVEEEEVEIVTSGKDLSEILTQGPSKDEDNFMITVTPSISLTSEEESLLENDKKDDSSLEPTLAGMVMDRIMQRIEELAEKKDTDVDMTKKSTDPISEKKTSGRRRGNWRLVRKRPVDNFEAAESQNYRSTYLNSVESVDIKASEAPGDIDLGTGSPLLFTTTKKTVLEETTTSQPVTEVTSVNVETTTNVEEAEAEIEATTVSNHNNTSIPLTTETPDTTDTESPSSVEIDTTMSPVIREIGGLIEEAIMKIAGAENIEEESNEPTEATTSPSTELPSKDSMDSVVLATSTSTEISHETEICYRGRCIKTDTDLEIDQK